MTCRHVRKTLANSAPVELSPEVLSQIKHHAESCAKCAALLAKAQRLDAALALMLADPEGAVEADALLASAETRKRPAQPRYRRSGPGFRWLAIAGGTSLTLVFGVLLGAIVGMAILAPTVEAKIPAEALDVPFLNDAFVRGGGYFDDFESGLGDWEPQQHGPNFAELSDDQAHSGRKSLKFYHREYGGFYMKRFNTPIPPNSVIRLATWVLSPRGGTADNKWLNLGIGLEAGPSASIDVLTQDTRWQPMTMQLYVAQGADRFHVAITTGPGNGNHKGWDWTSWVDDVRVYLTSGVERTLWVIEGDTVHMAVKLPMPYGKDSVDFSRVFVRDLQKRIEIVRASKVDAIRTASGDLLIFKFQSADLVRFIREEEDSNGEPVHLQVVFSAQIGDIPCIFSTGICRE